MFSIFTTSTQPTIAVDTHLFRVANRTGLAPGSTPEEVERVTGLPGWAALPGTFLAVTLLIAVVFFLFEVMLILAWRNAGYYGLDRYVLPALGTPWHPGKVFEAPEEVRIDRRRNFFSAGGARRDGRGCGRRERRRTIRTAPARSGSGCRSGGRTTPIPSG